MIKTKTVVPLRETKELPCNDAFAAGQILSREITLAVQSGQTLTSIARRSKLSHHTVSKLYYNETKFPRFDTIMKLMREFNFNVYVKKIGSNT